MCACVGKLSAGSPVPAGRKLLQVKQTAQKVSVEGKQVTQVLQPPPPTACAAWQGDSILGRPVLQK